MNESYEELSRHATKGDENALRKLFCLAQEREAENNFQDATVTFRDAAISYRISAFRNLARAEDAESRVVWLSEERDIYKRWISANPNGLRELPYCAPDVTSGRIWSIVIAQLSNEKSFIPVFMLLEESLSAMGMEFSSPGGSIQRRVCRLLEEVFGLQSVAEPEYLGDLSVRVGLDLLADEVAKRCRTDQPAVPGDAAK